MRPAATSRAGFQSSHRSRTGPALPPPIGWTDPRKSTLHGGPTIHESHPIRRATAILSASTGPAMQILTDGSHCPNTPHSQARNTKTPWAPDETPSVRTNPRDWDVLTTCHQPQVPLPFSSSPQDLLGRGRRLAGPPAPRRHRRVDRTHRTHLHHTSRQPTAVSDLVPPHRHALERATTHTRHPPEPRRDDAQAPKPSVPQSHPRHLCGTTAQPGRSTTTIAR